MCVIALFAYHSVLNKLRLSLAHLALPSPLSKRCCAVIITPRPQRNQSINRNHTWYFPKNEHLLPSADQISPFTLVLVLNPWKSKSSPSWMQLHWQVHLERLCWSWIELVPRSVNHGRAAECGAPLGMTRQSCHSRTSSIWAHHTFMSYLKWPIKAYVSLVFSLILCWQERLRDAW